MRSKFGGIAVEEIDAPTSRFGGVPVVQEEVAEVEPGFLERSQKEVESRLETSKDDFLRTALGQQSGAELALQIAGNQFAALGDVVGEGVVSAFEMLPENVQGSIKSGAQQVLESDIGKMGVNALQKGSQEWEDFKRQEPRTARNLESLLAVGSIGVAAGTRPVERTVEAGVDVARRAGETALEAGKVVASVPEKIKVIGQGKQADQILRAQLTDDPEIVLQRLKDGEISVLADVGGDEIRALTRAIGKVKGGARETIVNALEKRSEGAVTRVSEELSRSISPVTSYFENLDNLAKARSSLSAPKYAQAYKKGAKLKQTPTLNTLRQDERIVSALAEAKRDLGIPAETTLDSLEGLDGVKKVLDDRILEAQRKGRNNLARVTGELKNNLLKELDSQVPEYRQARKIFSSFSQLENAQQEGLNFNKLRPEQLRGMLKDLSNSEKEAFKIGVRENLQKIVSSTPDGADPAKRIFGNEFKREQLRAVFSQGEQFDKFKKLMQQEIKAADTKFKVLGGSRTDINITDDTRFINTATDAARQGIVATTIDRASQAIFDAIRRKYTGINDKNAKELSKILVDRDKGIEALEKIVERSAKDQKPIIKEVIDDVSATIE